MRAHEPTPTMSDFPDVERSGNAADSLSRTRWRSVWRLMFTDLVRISWFSIAVPCLPFDLVVMPIWLLQLAGEKTGLRTVSFFVGNVVLFVVIAATAGPHLPAELRGAGPLAVAATAFLRSVTSRR